MLEIFRGVNDLKLPKTLIKLQKLLLVGEIKSIAIYKPMLDVNNTMYFVIQPIFEAM